MAAPSRELVLEICREIANLVPCDRIDLALPSEDGETLTVMPLHPHQADAAVVESDGLPQEFRLEDASLHGPR